MRARLQNSGSGWLAAGGAFGAILASSCCILPLAFVLFGVSGAWIGNLTSLEPFKPYFLIATFLLLGAGFWQVYFRAKPDCEEGTYCAKPASSTITKTILWSGTVLALLVMTVDLWAPLFY